MKPFALQGFSPHSALALAAVLGHINLQATAKQQHGHLGAGAQDLQEDGT